MVKVTDRTLEAMLRELRTMDRDRDRILRAQQIRLVFERYRVGTFSSVLKTFGF